MNIIRRHLHDFVNLIIPKRCLDKIRILYHKFTSCMFEFRE